MVIKAASAQRAEPLGLRAFRIDDVLREAHENIAAARAEAERIIAEARVEAEKLRVAARETGRREGYDAGFPQGQRAGFDEARTLAIQKFAEQGGSLINAFQQVLQEIERERATWRAVARQDLVELALSIARRIVLHVGENERQAVLKNLEEAIRLTGSRTDVTIFVNPVDAEAARTFAQALLDAREEGSGLRVTESTDVSPGGCRVHWGTGSVDARLETQLDRIREALGSKQKERDP